MAGPSKIVETAPKWAAECEKCRGIWSALADPESAEDVSFGSFEEALSTRCPNHKPLVQAFADYVGPEDVEASDSTDVGIVVNGDATITQSISELGIYCDLLLVNKPAVPNHPGLGRIVHPEWVDLDLLKMWKQTCLESHGSKCHNPFKISPARPSWMIDVERMCLVSGDAPGSFVALSYGDGRHKMTIIGPDALMKLQEPNSLNDLGLNIILTPIIRHAMHLTLAMGERYLWASTLCMTAPDRKSEAELLARMGEIYASATVTIIGADEHSASQSHVDDNDKGSKAVDSEVKPTDKMAEPGLYGLKGVSNPRRIDQTVIPFGDEKITFRNSGFVSFTFASGVPYYSQGWTYQQCVMSPRKVLFSSNEMHWECQCATWHEETALLPSTNSYIDPKLGVITSGFPDSDALGCIISDYSDRALQFDEDVLPAISSLLLAASRTFKGGFLYGIPEMFFEHGLTWSPHWDHTQLQRRSVSGKNPTDSKIQPPALPSWSWMGWKGLISYRYGEATRINNRVGRIEETVPITEWYTSKSPSDPPSERRRIRSSWYENRDTYKDLTKPIPAGWTRHDSPTEGDGPHLYPDGCERYVFTHERFPDPEKETKAWYYPVPVVEVQESTPGCMPEQTRYLFCETSRVRLFGYQLNQTGSVGADNYVIDLFNSAKEKIGSMHLHGSELLHLFPKSLSEEGFSVELVAVCKKKIYSNTWNSEKEVSELPRNRKDIYSVLWVEWKDGVAYRLAGGNVTATEWENSGPEPLSLILG